jgi:hypothetical protein
MRQALGKDSIIDDIADDIERLESKGWELVDTMESKGTTCALVFKRPDDYEGDGYWD